MRDFNCHGEVGNPESVFESGVDLMDDNKSISSIDALSSFYDQSLLFIEDLFTLATGLIVRKLDHD